MFAKVFTQILDSSLAEDYQVRHVFEDLLKLCDINGVVDMTHEAISRRTNVPIDIVKRGIAELEKPDDRSRNPDHAGCRIVRLDEHRDWGWIICNYDHYRHIASEEQRREKTAKRTRDWRAKKNGPGDAPVTPGDAGDAMQKQREREYDKASGTIKPTKPKKLSKGQKELAERFEATLGTEWTNDSGKWINRIKSKPDKSERVVAEVESAAKENRITGTPARFAEHLWGTFK